MMIFRWMITVIAAGAMFWSGCVHVDSPGRPDAQGAAPGSVLAASDDARQIALLKEALIQLDDSVDEREARLVAREATFHSMDLARQYRLVKPPLIHNILVNIGFKDRGLCTHWTEDLIKHLAALELQTFHLHWGLANRKRTFHIQHSSVVVTAVGQPFEKGIVLDPWRNSGRLYWGPVKTDRYPWEKWTHFSARKIHESYRHP